MYCCLWKCASVDDLVAIEEGTTTTMQCVRNHVKVCVCVCRQHISRQRGALCATLRVWQFQYRSWCCGSQSSVLSDCHAHQQWQHTHTFWNRSWKTRVCINFIIFPCIATKQNEVFVMFFRHTNITTSCCSCSNVIGVKPTRGYIEVNQHQVFVVKLALTDVNLYHQIVYFKLNDSVKNTQVGFKRLHSVL